MKLETLLIICVLGLVIVPRLDIPQITALTGTQTQTQTPKYFSTSLSSTLPDAQTRAFVSGLSMGISDSIARDGTRDPQKLKYVANIQDLRTTALDIGMDGKKLKDIAPQFGVEVGKVFQTELPDGTKELDDATRKKSIDLFKSISEVLE